MNEFEMSRYISESFAGVDVVVEAGNSFFFYNPDPSIPPDHMFPWVTLMSSGKRSADDEAPFSDYDFTALDRVMPHPVYGKMYWVCVLNPSDNTLATAVRPLLDEAYATAVSKFSKRR